MKQLCITRACATYQGYKDPVSNPVCLQFPTSNVIRVILEHACELVAVLLPLRLETKASAAYSYLAQALTFCLLTACELTHWQACQPFAFGFTAMSISNC